MTAEPVPPLAVPEARRPAPDNPTLLRRLLGRRVAIVAISIIVIYVLAATVGVVFSPYDPQTVSGVLRSAPSSEHWFGTDDVGKDIFSGVLKGAQPSLLIGCSVGLIAAFLGIVVGGIAGYFGGWLESLLMRITELFQIIPAFILALVAVAILGHSMGIVIAVIGLTMWPQIARIVRTQVVSIKEREFVEAARSVGFPHRYILRSEILPNAIPPAVVASTLIVGRAILLEAGLSFLGLADASNPSWGAMLNRAQPYLSTAWWMSIFPGLSIFLTVVAFNLLGDALNDVMNPEDR